MSTRIPSLVAALVLGVACLAITGTVQAQSALGTAQSFGVLAGSTVTNTGTTVIMGDVGVSPGGAITGFPPGSVVPPSTIDAVALQAQSDNTTAYKTLAGTTVTTNLTGQDLGGKTLTPGVYAFSSSAQLTGTLLLNGNNNPNSLFIFDIASTLTTASASNVSLINGAKGGNVFWLVGSSATLGNTTSLTGNILALTSITLNKGANIVCGSALAQTGAVTLDTNVIIIPGVGVCGVVLPPGVVQPGAVLPSGVVLPPGVVPVVLAPGVVLPPGLILPPGLVLPAGVVLPPGVVLLAPEGVLFVNLNDLLSGGGLTHNQTKVADAIFPTITSLNGNPIIDALGSLPPSHLAAALNAISGEGVSGTQQRAFGASNLFMSAVMEQATFWRDNTGPDLVGITPAPMELGPTNEGPKATRIAGYQPRTWRLWTNGLGGTTSLDGNAETGSADLNTAAAGFASGLDYQIDHTTLVGIAGGYITSDFSVDQRQTSGTAEGPHVGLYGMKRLGAVYLAGTAEYAHFDNETERGIALGGPVSTERETGKFASDDVSGRLEAGWEQSFGRLNVTPFAGVQGSRLWTDGFTENSVTLDGGPGIFGLKFGSHDVTSRLSSLGVQLDTRIALANGMMLSPFGRVAWLHEFDPERNIIATLISLPGASFSIDGASVASDAAKVIAGLKLDITERTWLFAFFDGDFSGQGQSYGGTGGLKFTW